MKKQLGRNTVKHPLVLSDTQYGYKVNKPLDQSGKYVEFELAEKMLVQLSEAKLEIEYLQAKFKKTGTGNTTISRIKSLIEEANQ